MPHASRVMLEWEGMSDAAPRLATYDDLLALPEETRAEIVAGEVRTAPGPLPKHSRAVRALGSCIGGPFDDDDGRGGPGGWWILVEVDVRQSEHDIVRPDLAGWRRERLPEPWIPALLTWYPTGSVRSSRPPMRRTIE